MSAWWLLLIIPGALVVGAAVALGAFLIHMLKGWNW